MNSLSAHILAQWDCTLYHWELCLTDGKATVQRWPLNKTTREEFVGTIAAIQITFTTTEKRLHKPVCLFYLEF